MDVDRASAVARIGRTLRGKWHLDALLQVGGMGAVYAATHRNGMRGAVKILNNDASLHPEARARFLREGYIANKIAHPNVVRVLDDDVNDDGSVFVVMELLDGATLHECARAAGGKLAPDEVLLIADQLLEVLEATHQRGIVHRDIKPDNVFLTADGQVKILDFGIASVSVSDACEPGRSPTIAGLLMGSPAYMSPEQARGRWDLVGAHSDLWSVGATIFALLCGQSVHPEGTMSELLAAIILTPARSLASVLPDAHPALVEVVDRALRTSPTERWSNAADMREGVRAAYRVMYGASLPFAANSNEKHHWPAPSRALRRWVNGRSPNG